MPGPVLAHLPAGTSYHTYLADYQTLQTSEVLKTSEVTLDKYVILVYT